MKIIQFSNPHRQKHFDFFRQMDQPHFNITANLDITHLQNWIKANQLTFTPVMVFCIAKTANTIPEFKQRIRDEQLIEHDAVHPSFTVLTEVSDVFSFCTVPYQQHFNSFHESALNMINRMKTEPSFEDEAGRDDYLFLSAIPWIAFTSILHPMHYTPVDSVPRIAWGKYFTEGGRIKLPFSVQAHHSIVDGIHMGRYFEFIQDLFDEPELIRSMTTSI